MENLKNTLPLELLWFEVEGIVGIEDEDEKYERCVCRVPTA